MKFTIKDNETIEFSIRIDCDGDLVLKANERVVLWVKKEGILVLHRDSGLPFQLNDKDKIKIGGMHE